MKSTKSLANAESETPVHPPAINICANCGDIKSEHDFFTSIEGICMGGNTTFLSLAEHEKTMTTFRLPHDHRVPDASALADAAEALGNVRSEDGAPIVMTWAEVLEAIRELRADYNHLVEELAGESI
jgi:hypothetical protein